MNLYAVKTKDVRDYVEPILDDGSGPSFPIQPLSPVYAESAAQAKHYFLREYADESRSGVYSDDYPHLRVRLVAKGVELIDGKPPGVRDEDDSAWAMMYEVLGDWFFMEGQVA